MPTLSVRMRSGLHSRSSTLLSRTLDVRLEAGSRLSTLHGEHDEVITEPYGIEGLGDRRSAERCRVGRSAGQARHFRLAQLWYEGETVTRLWRGGEMSILED